MPEIPQGSAETVYLLPQDTCTVTTTGQAVVIVNRNSDADGAGATSLVTPSAPLVVGPFSDASTIRIASANGTASCAAPKALVGPAIVDSSGALRSPVDGALIQAPVSWGGGISTDAGNALKLGTDSKPYLFGALTNSIGTPGKQGFGVGICPSLPAGYSLLPGTTDIASDNYGNYTYSDGSVMIWVPAFYYRIGSTLNPTYGFFLLNSVDVQPLSAFATEAAANAAGYASHRAFWNAGAIQQGKFIDKYGCSNNSGTASSIKLGNPLSTSSAHNPIGALTGAPANNYGGCFAAAKTRGTKFHPAMRWDRAMLALLAQAHGQASTSAAQCAWWAADGSGYPRGSNNSALRDSNVSTVGFVSDGYSGSAKCGSGTPFAMTTHNGQACGIADLNGNLWEVSPGITCIAADKPVAGVALTNPCQITITTHGYTTGRHIQLGGMAGSTQLNDRIYKLTVIDANTISLDGVNATSGISAWTSDGYARTGRWYAINTSVDIATVTGGASLATDQWGATGVAAHSTEITPNWRTDYPNNGLFELMGNGATQVLSPAQAGDDWTRTGLGMPGQPTAVSGGGTGIFGNDYCYMHIANEMCPLAGGTWWDGGFAGVWAVLWRHSRGTSADNVGFRAASFP